MNLKTQIKLSYKWAFLAFWGLSIATQLKASSEAPAPAQELESKRYPIKKRLAKQESYGRTRSSEELQQRWAIGTNLAWVNRRDYGARDFRRFSPELVGYTYGELPWIDTFWRAGTRLGYSNSQPEMPQAVRIEETDTIWTVEGGILRNWYVVPSLSWGVGYDFRTTRVKTQAPLDVVDDRLNRKERLLMWYVQGGLGFPLYHGTFMIEPIARYHTIEYDDRSHWLFGFEMTVGF